MKKSTMQKINKPNFNKHPLLVKSHARVEKIFFILLGLGIVFPFVLPESNGVINSRVFEQLSAIIPSAGKLASAALIPDLVHTYVLIMLFLAFLAGLGHIIFLTPLNEQLKANVLMNAPRGMWNLWLKALLGIPVFTAILAFFYIFPGQPTGDPHGSRGQFIVNLILMTKPGLAIFGGIASAGCFAGWWILFFSIYTLLFLPFLRLPKY